MALVSMTGFGRARGQLSVKRGASVVVRSVNHRYLDIQVRTNLREEVPEIEALVKAGISKRFHRGRVTAQLNLEQFESSHSSVTVNTDQVAGVLQELASIPLPEGIQPTVALGDVLAVPGLVSVSSQETLLDDDETAALRSVVVETVDAALTMRVDEGERLGHQIREELALVIGFVDWFEPQLPEMRQAVMDRTLEKVGALLESKVDPERLAQEAAVMADRADVAEEVVRLRSHFTTFGERLEAGGTVGRTLDFLCQEIHRELNTLGSKCRELGVAERLVDAKSAMERVREQVQNLE
jgi:uncharacterized protein (TIGR00255 family)